MPLCKTYQFINLPIFIKFSQSTPDRHSFISLENQTNFGKKLTINSLNIFLYKYILNLNHTKKSWKVSIDRFVAVNIELYSYFAAYTAVPTLLLTKCLVLVSLDNELCHQSVFPCCFLNKIINSFSEEFLPENINVFTIWTNFNWTLIDRFGLTTVGFERRKTPSNL